MDYSANDLIKESMEEARIIAPGEAIPAGKSAAAYKKLNGLLESWSLEKLMVVADVQESFPLVVGDADYSYGASGNFNSARPLEIRNQSFIRSGDMDYPVTVYALDMYRRICNKSGSGRPSLMAYHPTYPLGMVYLWPTPESTDRLYMLVVKTLDAFTDLTTAVGLAPGYSRAIITNFAVELCNGYGKKVSKELAFVAEQSKRSIKSANSVPRKRAVARELASMVGGGSGGDINSGPWGV